MRQVKKILDSLREYLLFGESELIGKTPIRVGLWIVLIFIGVFGTWAALAPIGASAIAPGQMVLDFNKKSIQHLEGGIVHKIWVKENQFVQKGDALITLEDVNIRAEESTLTKQYLAAKTLQTRLQAELEQKDDIPKTGLPESEDLSIAEQNQRYLFNSRKRERDNQKDILRKKKQQHYEQIKGLSLQKRSLKKRLELAKTELIMIDELLKTQNTSIDRQMDVEKQIAELDGQLGSVEAQIAASNQEILSINLEISQLDTAFRKEVLESLQEAEVLVADLEAKLSSTEDVIRRSIIRAPLSGKVMNIQYHTIGAVIQPGGLIMNVVPQDKEVVVEAKVKLEDIDSVYEGLEAKVLLSAYKVKKVPKIGAKVLSVSADSLMDEITGIPYYLARVQLSKDELSQLKTEVKLYPGMPAQVFIMTGSRTLLNYLMSPISDAAYRAFRED